MAVKCEFLESKFWITEW